MTAHLPAALAFSLVAALAVALAGRRHVADSDRLSALALLILLALPLLARLPGWTVLPAAENPGVAGEANFLAWLLPLGTTIALLRLLRASRVLRRWIRTSSPLGHVFTDYDKVGYLAIPVPDR